MKGNTQQPYNRIGSHDFTHSSDIISSSSARSRLLANGGTISFAQTQQPMLTQESMKSHQQAQIQHQLFVQDQPLQYQQHQVDQLPYNSAGSNTGGGGGGFFTRGGGMINSASGSVIYAHPPLSSNSNYYQETPQHQQQNQMNGGDHIATSYASSGRKDDYFLDNNTLTAPLAFNSNGLLQNLEETLLKNNEWINIQGIVRQSFRTFYELYTEQQIQMQLLQDQISSKLTRQDLNEALVTKAEVSDVSKAVTEVIKSVDFKPELDDLRKQLSTKLPRQEFITQLKAHQSMIDDLKKQEIDIRGLINECNQEYTSLRQTLEDQKRDNNKKLAQIYRELEKMQLSIERKVNIEEFNERIEVKADKQMLANALDNKVNKSEIDQAVNAKCDSRDVERMVKAVEIRFEQEIQTINETLQRKSNMDDIQYYRKELAFKLEKSELEAFRQEFVERVSAFDFKLNEKNQFMQQFRDTLESKVETQFQQLKQKIYSQLDQKTEINDLHLLKQDMRNQFDKLNDLITSVRNDNLLKSDTSNEKFLRALNDLQLNQDTMTQRLDDQQSELGKFKEQIKYLVKERTDDVQQISELLKNSQKKTLSEIARVQKDIESRVNQVNEELSQGQVNVKEELEQRIESEVSDKVRVDEVQDALRRLTESYQSKLETIYEDLQRSIATKNEDCYAGLERLKNDIQDLGGLLKKKVSQEQLDTIISQVEYLSKDLITKSDKKNTQAQLDFLNENMASVNKELIMKANIQDVMIMIDKKSNNDEVQLDLNFLKNTFQKHVKESKQVREEQRQLNEALCSENCVARWIWKTGSIESSHGYQNQVKWDLQSVNTCPENFHWKQGNCQILVDAPGLYEITMAFFSKKKKPLIQVLANSEVIIQSVSKTVCNSCGSACQVQANGHVQKLGKDLYKVNVIEFVALQSKSVINVVFDYLRKGKENVGLGLSSSVAAEGFIGIRKL